MMPEEKRQLLLKVFSMLKQKIIWKVRGDNLIKIWSYGDHIFIVGG